MRLRLGVWAEDTEVKCVSHENCRTETEALGSGKAGETKARMGSAKKYRVGLT